MTEAITSFSKEFAFLSNFYPAPIVHGQNGWTWPTAEHLYQACKCCNLEDARRILETSTPGQAKRMGRKVTIREDWPTIRISTMEMVLTEKFKQNPALANALLATGDALLIEGNTWGDQFWGSEWNGSTWAGENHLGRLLMKIRDNLR